VTGPDMLDD
jgi:hypothetical protein